MPDLTYLLVLAALVSIGLVMVYSTTAVDDGFAKFSSTVRQMLTLGIPFMLAGIFLPVHFWRKATLWLLFFTFLALLSLEIFHEPLVPMINGAHRWIHIPGLPNIQPSEFAKLAFILFAAAFLERRGQKMELGDWATFLAVLGGFAGIIYLEPDLGTALVLAGTAFCMLIAAGVRTRALLALAVAAAVMVAGLAWNTSHQQQRLKAWWNPWAEEYRMEGGYQVTQSWLAMARGGWWGVGLGRSVQKLDNHLPEPDTDFIFAIVAEEMGLVRSVVVLWLFTLLAWRGYAIAARAPDRYTGLVVTGVTSWIAVQSGLNIAVVTGTLPNTGVPLPFISAGGSSLLSLMAATGLIIGLSCWSRPGAKPANVLER
jgi:cell division protein FtsW